LTKVFTKNEILDFLRKRALRRVFESPLLDRVVRTLKDLRLKGSNESPSNTYLGTFICEQDVRSRRGAEFRNAQALEWYFRQKRKMM
jgi:hypothetical protein